MMDDCAGAERTVVSLLTDDPLLDADQVEEVGARRDDGLRTLQVEIANATDVTVLVQLGLAGGGEGGGEYPNAVSPVQVVINPVPDGMSEADKVTEENVRVYSWFVHQEKTLTDAGTGHGHNIEHINGVAEKN